MKDCGRLHHARGWCSKHWHRWYKFGAPEGTPPKTVEDRFWEKVATGTPEECWNWTGATGNGYGKFYFDGTVRYAHAISHRMHNGPSPRSDFILHSCDNKLCVNPAHLDAGTPKRNSGEAAMRGRLKTKLTWEQAAIIRDSVGSPAEIGALYGISRRMVWLIRTGKAWTIENQPS